MQGHRVSRLRPWCQATPGHELLARDSILDETLDWRNERESEGAENEPRGKRQNESLHDEARRAERERPGLDDLKPSRIDEERQKREHRR